MKTKSLFLSLLFAATAFAFISGCSEKKDDTTDSHEGHATEQRSTPAADVQEASTPQFRVDGKFRHQLTSLFNSYVELKDAFVDSDAQKVTKQAAQTKEALANVDMKLLSGAAHNDWMNYLTEIHKSIDQIGSSADIEAQREAFSVLSDNLYKSIKAFGLNGKEAFYHYCPMASNNEGSYWLSEEVAIRNPYFGEKMLTCGEVKEKLM
jgi:Cu(I)/Ag(I) efflux system membrane fusion protein